MGFFNIYTYDSGGEWSRYRINRRRDVERALPIVRTSFEACLAGRDPRQVQKKSKPKKKAPPTEEEFWSSLQQQAPTEHEAIRQLIDWYRARDDIELDSMRVGLLVRLDIRDTGRQATIFLAQSSGSLGVWPATIRGQLRKAGVDPSPVERYDAEIRRLVKKPTQSKEFYRSIADVNVDEFKTAVDELIKEIQQTN
jgi:hypothetical protein